jgi:hypothetical protein
VCSASPRLLDFSFTLCPLATQDLLKEFVRLRPLQLFLGRGPVLVLPTDHTKKHNAANRGHSIQRTWIRLLPQVWRPSIRPLSRGAGKPITVKGYVLDSACAFTKGLRKPISKECATACAKAGSPLVILTDDGTIYWPIAHTTPSSGQNEKLLPFAGQEVTASGKGFQRGGSSALVIEKIEPLSDQK